MNYCGDNTIGFFAPHSAYSHIGDHGQQVTEFKTIVKTFHWKGDGGQVGALGYRLTGSSDLYAQAASCAQAAEIFPGAQHQRL